MLAYKEYMTFPSVCTASKMQFHFKFISGSCYWKTISVVHKHGPLIADHRGRYCQSWYHCCGRSGTNFCTCTHL